MSTAACAVSNASSTQFGTFGWSTQSPPSKAMTGGTSCALAGPATPRAATVATIAVRLMSLRIDLELDDEARAGLAGRLLVHRARRRVERGLDRVVVRVPGAVDAALRDVEAVVDARRDGRVRPALRQPRRRDGRGCIRVRGRREAAGHRRHGHTDCGESLPVRHVSASRSLLPPAAFRRG